MNGIPFTPGVRSARVRPQRTRHILRHVATLVVAIGAAGLPACENPEEFRRLIPGRIDFEDPAWPLPEIPDTATAGAPVQITVWTGGSGCYEYALTEGGVDGLSASVSPRDYFIVGGCSSHREFIEHRTTRVFDEPGTAEITLHYSAYHENYQGTGEARHLLEQKVYAVEVAAAEERRSSPDPPQRP